MKCVVTGGAGFIGSHLTKRLVREGHEVVVLDNLSTGKKDRLASVEKAIDFLEGDIRDYELLKKVFKGAEVVFHQAALPSVARSVDDPLESNDSNVTGTLTVLEAARKSGVKRVVYAASSSAYGDVPALPKREDMKPAPRSPYAISKLAGEYYCEVFWRLFGLETVSLRYFNVFGPGQDPKSQYAAVIPKFISAGLKGEPACVFGDGLQSRDFTYVENVVEANLLAARCSAAVGQVINVACGKRTTLLDLLKILGEILGLEGPLPAEFKPPRPGDVRHSLADITKAEKLLGYRVIVGLEEGLRRAVDWYKSESSFKI